MKIYVDKKEEDLIEDSLYADNTRLISEFNHEESELEYDDCELIDIGIHDRQVRDEVKQKIWKEFEQRLMNKTEDMPVMKVANMINSVLDQIQG